ncbi:MAG: chloride channel protein [Bacteroidales bacterium]|nr:chloride channel protein [Bacteroidales bacterium]
MNNTLNKWNSLLSKFTAWRIRRLTDKQLMLILSVIVGLLVGFAAVIIKNLVHLIQVWVSEVVAYKHGFLFIVAPLAGLSLTVVFVKYINRKPVRHGIPGVLFALSKKKGIMNTHNLYSSIVTSALTVGFGGSVGLEGPTVATGGAIGSTIGQMLRLSYKQITLLLGCACAGAMAAIFKAPIAAIVFALEVIMLDLTMAAIVPLLISSATATLTSYFFLGQNFLYSFSVTERFQLDQVLWYIIFAVFTGLLAVYFNRMYNFISELFEKLQNVFARLIIGGIILGIIIFLVPSLYGEGYEVINSSLRGQYGFLYDNTLYSAFRGSIWMTMILFMLLMLFKVIATTVTFGSGGVGGVFAPTLFTGGIAGLFFARVLGMAGVDVNSSNFALVGMAGMISAVIHAPLTAIFLIAEISGGYQLFMPLMIVATISYATTKIFVANSVYTIQLAKRGELLTHHKDKALLMMLKVSDLIETDFNVLRPSNTLGELVETIKFAHRNIFPVVEKDGTFRGMIKLDDIRHIMFNTELYNSIYVRDLMFMPEQAILSHDTVEEVAMKFKESGRYNITVLEHGKYLGFISRAKLFSSYRTLMEDFSEE